MTPECWQGCKRAFIGLSLALIAGCVDIDALRGRSCGPRCDDEDGGAASDASTDAALHDAGADANRSQDAAATMLDASTDAARDQDADSGPSIVPPVLPKCADQWVDKLGTHSASTNSAGNDFAPSCSTGKANDSSFYFVVPETGYYELSTKGSSFDNTLALMSASCNGTELACSKADDTNEAFILRKLQADDDYVIVVDGNSGSHGAVELNVNRISCPDVDLSEQTLPLTGTTADGANKHEGSCGGAGQREKSYLWTAPADGLYAFKLSSSKFEPLLYVEQGLRCGGELLGCNRGTKSTTRAQVTRHVAAGESVTLIVDSAAGSGAFTLDVEALAATCPGATRDPKSDPSVTRTLAPTDPSLLTGSCLPTAISQVPGGTYELAEHTYGVVVQAGFGCTLNVEANGPVAIYVLEGNQCAGAETFCANATEAAAPYSVSTSIGDFTSSVSSSWTVVIESSFPHSGSVEYTLSSYCFSP